MKTAIITGVSSGIGEVIADTLLKRDWRVIGLYHSTRPVHVTDAHKIDLSDLDAVKALAGEFTNELTHLDALVHAAAIWHDGNELMADMPFTEFTPEQIIKTMNVGMTSFMIMCNQLLPILKHGTVIGISGTFSEGGAGWLPYFTAKRALEDFLVGLSQDCEDVQVYGISPADTATPAYKKFYPQYAKDAQQPEEIAKLVRNLILRTSNFNNGSIIELREEKPIIGFHK